MRSVETNVETNNELCEFSFSIIITSPVESLRGNRPENGIGRATMSDPVSLARLLVIAALGYVFHRIQERLGAGGAMNTSIEYVVPRDVRLQMMRFGLLFELSL